METQDRWRYDHQVAMFKALAHPMRLLMLERLRLRPWCVCELATEVGIEKSVASKHLSQLRDAGLIEDERHGTMVEYRLIASCILDMADCAERTVLARAKERFGVSEAQAPVAAPRAPRWPSPDARL